MKLIALHIAAAATLLAGCATTAPVTLPATSPPSALTPAQNATLETAAALADAVAVAPPAALVPVVIDDAAVIRAWFRFDQALDVIDQLVALGVLKPGTPRALAVAQGVRATKAALSAASDAQRAGTATSYTAALKSAQQAIRTVQVALMENGR